MLAVRYDYYSWRQASKGLTTMTISSVQAHWTQTLRITRQCLGLWHDHSIHSETRPEVFQICEGQMLRLWADVGQANIICKTRCIRFIMNRIYAQLMQGTSESQQRTQNEN